MRSLAVLVIAALNQPVYRHYLEQYWNTAVRYCESIDNIDIFLLFESDAALGGVKVPDHAVLVDTQTDYEALCPGRFQIPGVPGILSKTISALEQLGGKYDVFFRTNLSSVLKLNSINRFVQDWSDPGYAGAFVWTDALRQDLMHFDRIGVGKSIASLAELDRYPGNTFISGSGYFLNAVEAGSLVARRDEIRFDIADDVSVGLMFSRHQLLPHFTLTLRPCSLPHDPVRVIEQHPGSHVRLEHLPLPIAEELWGTLEQHEVWAL